MEESNVVKGGKMDARVTENRTCRCCPGASFGRVYPFYNKVSVGV